MGVYVSLAELKDYGKITTNEDDFVLNAALDAAEANFHRLAGARFYLATYTQTTPLKASWSARSGMLVLVAREGAPVQSVQSVEFLLPGGSWSTLPLGTVILPPVVSPPHASCWRVEIYAPSLLLPPRVEVGWAWPPLWRAGAPGGPRWVPEDVAFRWTYTAGYDTPPPSLKSLIMRYAWWLYKRRDAPMERINVLGTFSLQVPMDAPPDIMREIREVWARPIA